MNRQIEFRAVIESDSGKVVSINSYGVEDMLTGYGLEWKFSDGTALPLNDVEKGRLTFEQYIGLKDKNGVKIFEGDKVFAHLNKATYIVKFGKYNNIGNDKDGDYGFYIIDVADGGCESFCCPGEFLAVIGNIHEEDK